MFFNKNNPKIRVLGVMTGNSCDGLDACLMEFTGPKWKSLWSKSICYPKLLKNRVLSFQDPDQLITVSEYLHLNRDLGKWYGQSLTKMISNSKQKPDVISNHGQTVCHLPMKKKNGTTLQLGDPSHIAHLTKKTVISHHRYGDLSAGGDGAPLAPQFHYYLAKKLFSHSNSLKGVAFLNIGGISNITYFKNNQSILAFDIGPGNIWIDESTYRFTKKKQAYDRGGKLASQGKIDQQTITKLLRHPFIKKTGVKSTSRDDFPFSYFLKKTNSRGKNQIATATEFTATCISHSLKKINTQSLIKTVVVCGGGAKNSFLIQRLKELNPNITIERIQKYQLDSQIIEAQAFALLGYLSLKGMSLGGSWTGVSSFAPPGWITPGENWSEVLKKISP